MQQLTEDKITKIEALLEKERKEWGGNITKLVKKISDASLLSACQVDMLSYRHMLIDKITDLNILLSKKRANDSNYTKTRYQYYKTNHDVRLDHREIMQYIQSDMSLRNRETNLIENQISYYKQAIETLDKMGFAIKNKVILATNDI